MNNKITSETQRIYDLNYNQDLKVKKKTNALFVEMISICLSYTWINCSVLSEYKMVASQNWLFYQQIEKKENNQEGKGKESIKKGLARMWEPNGKQ